MQGWVWVVKEQGAERCELVLNVARSAKKGGVKIAGVATLQEKLLEVMHRSCPRAHEGELMAEVASSHW